MTDSAERSLRLALALSFILSWASAEPFCERIDGHKYRRYVCRGFESPEDFKKHVPRNDSSRDTWFLLLDSAMDRLPPGAFAGLNISVLVLSNVTLGSFDVSQTGEGSPFSGLEESLRKMIFRRDSTLPSSWTSLAKMASLEELHLQRYLNLNLTRDFGKLPQSLKVLFVFDSSVNKMDDDWLVDLSGLEALIIRVTNMAVFSRSMLPKPAPKLTTLDLAENHLSAFPQGLGEDLPALQFVNLEDNRITTLDEKDVEPLHKGSIIVRLIGNPMHCDCKLWFLLDYTDRWHYFLCRSPVFHRGRYIKMLSEPELPCDYDTPAPPGAAAQSSLDGPDAPVAQPPEVTEAPSETAAKAASP